MLLGASFAVDELVVLVLEQLIGMAALAELLVDEPVLTSQGLDVFSKLSHLLGLELGQLGLLVDLFAQRLDFILEHPDFIFPLK